MSDTCSAVRRPPGPDRFDADRFAEASFARNERAHFPISLAPRRGLEEYFSFLEMKVHLGFLLPRFRMQRVEDVDPELEFVINLHSGSDIRLQADIRTA